MKNTFAKFLLVLFLFGALVPVQAKEELAKLAARIAPIQSEIDQLSRQFWVTKTQVKANGYDLTVSRYRQVEQDEAYYENPRATMERLLELERIMRGEIEILADLTARFL